MIKSLWKICKLLQINDVTIINFVYVLPFILLVLFLEVFPSKIFLSTSLAGQPEIVALPSIGFKVAAWLWTTGYSSADNSSLPTGNLGKFSKGTEYSFLELSISIQKSTAGIETLFHYWRHTQNVRLTDVSWVLNLKLKFSILAFHWYNTAKFFQMATICQSNDCCNWNLGKKSLEPPNNEIDGRFVWFIHHKTALCYLRCGYCSLWLNR